jgi:putative FmdB family regulatory protein
MPLYEYHCTACDTRFTRTETMSDHAKARKRPVCPKCDSSSAVEPVFSDFFAKTVRKS